MLCLTCCWSASLILVLFLQCIVTQESDFSNHLVVQLKPGRTVDDIHELFEIHDLKFIRELQDFSNDNLYLFKILHHLDNKPLNRSISKVIAENGDVQWFEQQTEEVREFRHFPAGYDFIHPAIRPVKHRKSKELTFNDPFYFDQWYLVRHRQYYSHNEGQTGGIPGNDLNVLPVWKAGFTGTGIVVSVLDDGIQHTNLDIKDNYEPSISYDMVDLEDGNSDPSPDLSGDNSHGTSCAAIIAAVANNNVCGVGIAFNAKIGGLRVMDGKVSDIQEALSLVYGLDKVDIFSASWGPKDDGQHLAGPRKLAAKALTRGIKIGRKGKGVIYVWAVGNGGLNHDNCNMDGYVSSIFTIAISALTHDGLSVYYSEPCTSILASAFVGGIRKNMFQGREMFPSLLKNWKEIFKDEMEIKVVVPELNGRCTKDFQGTSAAAPQAAGVIALTFEANPSLTWRDVQHLIVISARMPNAETERGWSINGAGLHFHFSYGFGVIDAARMVAAAQQWTPVGRQVKLTTISKATPKSILCRSNLTLYIAIPKQVSQKSNRNGVRRTCLTHLEHVVATVDIVHPSRKSLSLFLASPSGTISQLLTERKFDNRTIGIRAWDFMSVQFWNESPVGVWSFLASDRTPTCRSRSRVGRINHFSLTLYGTCRNDAPPDGSTVKVNDRSELRKVEGGRKRAYSPDRRVRKLIMETEKREARQVKIFQNRRKFKTYI